MTVTAWLKKLGVAYNYFANSLTEKEQRVLSMHQAGSTINKMRETGVSYEFIKKI